MTQANFLQVMPGTHCLRCHENYGGSVLKHKCSTTETSMCTDKCKELLANMSNTETWIDKDEVMNSRS